MTLRLVIHSVLLKRKKRHSLANFTDRKLFEANYFLYMQNMQNSHNTMYIID